MAAISSAICSAAESAMRAAFSRSSVEMVRSTSVELPICLASMLCSDSSSTPARSATFRRRSSEGAMAMAACKRTFCILAYWLL